MTKRKKGRRPAAKAIVGDMSSLSGKDGQYSSPKREDLSYLDRVNGNYLQAVTMYIDSRAWHPVLKITLKTLFLIMVISLVACLLCWPFLRVLN